MLLHLFLSTLYTITEMLECFIDGWAVIKCTKKLLSPLGTESLFRRGGGIYMHIFSRPHQDGTGIFNPSYVWDLLFVATGNNLSAKRKRFACSGPHFSRRAYHHSMKDRQTKGWLADKAVSCSDDKNSQKDSLLSGTLHPL